MCIADRNECVTVYRSIGPLPHLPSLVTGSPRRRRRRFQRRRRRVPKGTGLAGNPRSVRHWVTLNVTSFQTSRLGFASKACTSESTILNGYVIPAASITPVVTRYTDHHTHAHHQTHTSSWLLRLHALQALYWNIQACLGLSNSGPILSKHCDRVYKSLKGCV